MKQCFMDAKLTKRWNKNEIFFEKKPNWISNYKVCLVTLQKIT